MNVYYISPENRYGEQYFSFSNDFRRIAFEIDQNPQSILKYSDLPVINYLLSDCDSTAIKRTEYLEALSYGDPGVLLASPGPSLSGLMLRELGLPEQIDRFYRMIKENKMRTFFALTEPKKGSDASEIETQLIKNNKNYFLEGIKCFFGNGVVAETGVVLARFARSPIAIRAIWLTPDILQDTTIEKIPLPMYALRGAQIAAMQFNQTSIPHEQILGHHLSACENGLLGVIKVFNRLRTGVGALAIGQAQAVYDITYQLHQENFTCFKSQFYTLNQLLKTARHILHNAAKKVDRDPLVSADVSLAKANATNAAETVIQQCVDLCTLDQLIENPWLMKAYRDVFCWEFMEGTTHLQKKQIARNIPTFISELKCELRAELSGASECWRADAKNSVLNSH